VTTPYRVLVVDQSASMRAAVVRLLETDARFAIAGEAADGRDAVHRVVRLEPDVVTLGSDLPRLDGAQTTRTILELRPTPIILISGSERQSARRAVEALTEGAVDVVPAPDPRAGATEASRDELIQKLLLALDVDLSRTLRPNTPGSRRPPPRIGARRPLPTSHATGPASERGRRRHGKADQRPKLVVLAAGTGGPAALLRVAPLLRVRPDTSVLVVQHLPPGFSEALAEILDAKTTYPVREARDGEPFPGGQARVAPSGFHLRLTSQAALLLDPGAPVNGVRPSADVLLSSVAQFFGSRSAGVILTGVGRDGAMGLAALKAAGGRTIAQDRSTSIVYGMPETAARLGVVDTISPLERVADLVNRLLGPES
jgi:two-component system chemotaxis response regulator CheB